MSDHQIEKYLSVFIFVTTWNVSNFKRKIRIWFPFFNISIKFLIANYSQYSIPDSYFPVSASVEVMQIPISKGTGNVFYEKWGGRPSMNDKNNIQSNYLDLYYLEDKIAQTYNYKSRCLVSRYSTRNQDNKIKMASSTLINISLPSSKPCLTMQPSRWRNALGNSI